MKQGEKDGNFNPVTEDTQFESGETIILGNGEGVWANVGVRFFVNKKKKYLYSDEEIKSYTPFALSFNNGISNIQVLMMSTVI